jgi:hypothetical protein
MKNNVALFAPFEKVAKQADGSLIVDFTVTSEAVDDQNEIVDYDAVKKAAADYMEWAALREMHQPSAVGTTLTLDADDALRKVTGQGRVVDPMAILKVEEGVYKGVSMGGKKLATTMQKVGAKTVRRITDLEWTELSLVDRPSNPDAYLSLAKRSDDDAETDTDQSTGDEPVSKTATPAEAPEELAKSASDDILSAHIITEGISRLIQTEAADTPLSADQIQALQDAYAAMQRFEGMEATELGTPADTEEAIEEAAEQEAEAEEIAEAYASAPVILAAAQTGDLRKAGARNAAKDQAVLDNILAELIFLGAQMPAEGDAAATPSIADEPPTDDAAKVASAHDLAKVIANEFSKNAPFAKASDVAAIEEKLLKALEPMKEQLSKIAAQPMPGGPLPSYAPAPHWAGSESSDVTARVSEELTKMADEATNPMVAETLRKQAAAAEITAIRRGKVG